MNKRSLFPTIKTKIKEEIPCKFCELPMVKSRFRKYHPWCSEKVQALRNITYK